MRSSSAVGLVDTAVDTKLRSCLAPPQTRPKAEYPIRSPVLLSLKARLCEAVLWTRFHATSLSDVLHDPAPVLAQAQALPAIPEMVLIVTYAVTVAVILDLALVLGLAQVPVQVHARAQARARALTQTQAQVLLLAQVQVQVQRYARDHARLEAWSKDCVYGTMIWTGVLRVAVRIRGRHVLRRVLRIV